MPVPDPLELLNISSLLSDEETGHPEDGRGTSSPDRARPSIAGWFEDARFPRELVAEFGRLGLLGHAPDGYGCAGTNAVCYGLACLELEAVDSGLRSFVSGTGLAVDVLDPEMGVGGAEAGVASPTRRRRGHRVFRSDRSRPRFTTRPTCAHTPSEPVGQSADWILNGSKMWITNGGLADVGNRLGAGPTRASAASSCHEAPPASLPTTSKQKLSLRASVTSELAFDDVRLPGLGGVSRGHEACADHWSCLNEARFGIVFGVVGAAPGLAAGRPVLRRHRASSSAGRSARSN